MALLSPPSPPTMSNQEDPPPSSPSRASSSLTSPRSRKQLTLLLAGASFLTLSSLITRRQLTRRHLSTKPRFYQPSNRPPAIPVNGAVEALEALSLATINVASFMMMVTGGLVWAFDVGGLEDLRRRVRGGLGVDGSGRSEGDVEEEFEEWIAGVLRRKEEKEKEKEKEGKRRRRDGEGGEERFAVVEDRMVNERGRPR